MNHFSCDKSIENVVGNDHKNCITIIFYESPMDDTNMIKFYRVNDAYGEFSNFAAFPIALEGKTWPTSEHYFQAQKFVGTDYAEDIRKASGPMEAALMGRTRRIALRKDWELVKDTVMYAACWAKFTQHTSLKELLLSTGNAELIEHTSNDAYWGDGGDGSGRNMLGITLMNIREALKNT